MRKERVIANAGPIIAFSLIDRLDILQEIFSEVLVPEAVDREILLGGTLGLGLATYRGAKWIQVKAHQSPADPLLNTVLHTGEASVIQLARELDVKRVLIDEPKGRKIARSVYGLSVIGSARVLVEGKRQGVLPAVKDALQAMRESGYRLSDAIVSYTLREAGEEV